MTAQRRAGLTLLGLTTAALGLGLFVPPPAGASCAGPVLQVLGAPTAPPTTVSPNVELPVAQVHVGQALTVEATNVTDMSAGCADTGATGFGCGPPALSGPVPARRVSLVLKQGSETWALGVADARGPGRSVSFDVVLPAGLTPGEADLILRGDTLVAETQLRLVVT